MNTHTVIGIFTDDIVNLATYEDLITASDISQNHLNQIQTWLKKWRIKFNETKSVQMNFTLRIEQCLQVQLNNIKIPHSLSTKYLGFYMDSKMTLKSYIIEKRKQIDIKVKNMYWLISGKSRFS